MKFNAKVYVSLKKGYSDPEGETTANAVRASKAYEVSFRAEDGETAEAVLDEMCRRLLTNPTKDDYSFEIREVR
jgi:phosphoribosylformylglycinamidine synthase PurS subunit